MQGVTQHPLIDTVEVAERLAISVKSVRAIDKMGVLRGIRLTKRSLRYDVDDLAAYIAGCKSGPSVAWPDKFDAQIKEATGERIEPNRFLLRKAQVCEWLGISPVTLYRWQKAGKLPAVRLEPLTVTRYDAADVQALIESRRPDQIGERPALGSV